MKNVDHPKHYGGADNLYEAIKVIEAWALDFNLGNAVKYICRAGKKTFAPIAVNYEDWPKQARDATIEDLRKAAWYLNREIEHLSSTTDTSNS